MSRLRILKALRVDVAKTKSEEIDKANLAIAKEHERLDRNVTELQAEIAQLKRDNAIPKGQIPPEYECPLSLGIMVDPVFAADGHTCARNAR